MTANTARLDQLIARGACKGLNTWELETAIDLVKKAKRYGPSDKQEAFMGRLADKAEGKSTTPAARTEKLAGDPKAIMALFAMASCRLKFPKVSLLAADGTTVVLHLAGERSKYAGQVQITDAGSYPDNRYFGRIDAEGTLTQGRDMTPAVAELLAAFATDPAGVAAAYGRKTGNCCFCRKALTDERSTTVGYGPICAGNFGLPWGEVVREQVAPAVRNPAIPGVAAEGWTIQDEIDAEEEDYNRAFAAQERAQEEAAFLSDPDFLIDQARDEIRWHPSAIQHYR